MRAQRTTAVVFLLVAVTAALTGVRDAAAQTVNPTTAEFNPSPDHNVVSNGTAVVTRYDLEFYIPGAASPFQVNSLGKPPREPMASSVCFSRR